MALSAVEQQIADVLASVARGAGTISYSELVQRARLRLDLSRPPDRNQLSEWLGNVLRHELAMGRPALPAVALYKNSTDPGPGFFAVVDELGLRNPGEDDDAVHMRLLTNVFAHHRPAKKA